jgi:uncharacterized protein (DUF1330 family)
MSYYFIANIKINDEEEYDEYLSKVDDVFKNFNGEYIAVDDAPVVLEGNWEYTRIVLVKFRSKQEFKNWYYSSEYQEILKHRLTAARCDTILVKDNN